MQKRYIRTENLVSEMVQIAERRRRRRPHIPKILLLLLRSIVVTNIAYISRIIFELDSIIVRTTINKLRPVLPTKPRRARARARSDDDVVGSKKSGNALLLLQQTVGESGSQEVEEYEDDIAVNK